MNDEKVIVSIMILAYNHEPYIRKALDSIVMQQTDFKFEAIVGEDMSTDGTRTIIKEYAQKYPDIIKPIFRKKNLGASRNVVSTLKKCKGKYVAFLECDDYWIDPLKLQKQYEFLEKNPDYAGVMSDVIVVNRYGKAMVTGPKILDHELITSTDFAKTMYPYNQFKFLGCFMTRNYYIESNYSSYFFMTKYVTDFILEAISIIHGKIGFLSEYMAVYRWIPSHGNNFSAMKFDILCRDRINSLKVVMRLFPRNTHRWIYMRICKDYNILIDNYIQKEEYFKLIRLLLIEMSFSEKIFYCIYHLINNERWFEWIKNLFL